MNIFANLSIYLRTNVKIDNNFSWPLKNQFIYILVVVNSQKNVIYKFTTDYSNVDENIKETINKNKEDVFVYY